MAKNVGKISTKRLSTTEFKELIQATKDPFFFSQFIHVIHPVRGKVPFLLYQFQKAVLWQFLAHRFNIILKFRQAGVTELISMFCLWLAMYHPNKNIIIISINERVSKKVLRKIKYMYRNLPEHLRVDVVNGKGDELGTASELEFANGSLITSVPTTEEAARSEAVSLLVIDEAAIVRWADKIWASSFPTLSTGGASIVASCVTGDTEIICETGNVRIDTISPKKFGKQDISPLGLRVLSHKGKWQRIIGSVNKGKLETWEIRNRFGDILKCTPAHKLLTTNGWRSVRDIIEKDLNIIVYRSGINELTKVPITIPPEKELWKRVRGYPRYKVSNLGRVKALNGQGKWEIKESRVSRVNSTGKKYFSVNLWHKGNKKKRALHNLVAEHFIGTIPIGYQVNHINFNPEDNYVTNIEIVTLSENTKHAVLHSRGLTLGSKIGKKFPNLKLVGKIKEKVQRGKIGDQVIAEIYSEMGIKINRSYVSRICNRKRLNSVQISKLKIIRKYVDDIYDICVENDESYISPNNYVSHNTPYGIGNWYHKTWVNAFSNDNGFNAIRLRWQMHPERDIAWYEEMAKSLGPRRTAQEIDGDFLTSGNSVFDLRDIRAIEEELTDHISEISMNGSLYIHKQPQKGQTFFIGADVATGRSRDSSAFTIFDKYGEEYACFKQRISVGKFSDLLMQMGKKFNYASIAPETNDIGLAVTTKIQESGYRNLYYSKQLLRKKGESRHKEIEIPGWLTTTKNRGVIIDGLEEDIRQGEIITKDPFFVNEAYTFIYDDSNRPVAMGKGKRNSEEDELLSDEGFTDDSIMGKAITNHIRKGKVKGPIVLPR